MALRRISGVVTPPNKRTRRIEDYAQPRKSTNGQPLKGNRFSRATPVVVRRIGDATTPDITPAQLAENTYRQDGLGPYSELRGKLFASVAEHGPGTLDD
jgi:hypothetical protein